MNIIKTIWKILFKIFIAIYLFGIFMDIITGNVFAALMIMLPISVFLFIYSFYNLFKAGNLEQIKALPKEKQKEIEKYRTMLFVSSMLIWLLFVVPHISHI